MKDIDNKPDYTLANTKVEADGQPPRVYAVTDLKAYVKPPPDEELSGPDGSEVSLGTETMCQCVPVGECVCNTVSYYSGSNPCPDHCACVGDGGGGCGAVYYYPY